MVPLVLPFEERGFEVCLGCPLAKESYLRVHLLESKGL